MLMDRLTNELKQESPCTIVFVDDIVISNEDRWQVKESLQRWRYVLKRRGMKVCRIKSEYLYFNERETGLRALL